MYVTGQEVVQAMLPFSVTSNAIVYGGREHTTTNFPFYFLEFHSTKIRLWSVFTHVVSSYAN